MDVLDTRYYWLNRKLLLLVGQWPYQDPNVKFRRRIFVCVISLSASAVQITKIIRAERDFDLLAEIFTNEVLIMMCLIKHFNLWRNNAKIKALLEATREDWRSLNDNEERDIFERTVEDGRKYIFYCTLYLYSGMLLIIAALFSAPILDIIAPMNESHPKKFPIPVDYLIFNEQNSFHLIMTHGSLVLFTLITMVTASDTLYMTFLYHACALFKISSHQLRHVFNNCRVHMKRNSALNTTLCRRLAATVEHHRNAIRFSDKIVSAFDTCHLLTLILVLVNISITLYCTTVNWDKGMEAMSSLMLGASQMMHLLLRTYPPQKLIDDSSAISFDAYSAEWYAAPSKVQALLLFVMQRGMKPSAVVIGKICTLSMETYAMVMQTSLSYFMTLFSLKSV